MYTRILTLRKTRVCLTAHMDTVPPHIPPLRQTPDVIYGRGSCDDKGPMASQITALEDLRAEGPIGPHDVSLLFVAGEEKGGPGKIAANDMNLSWEAVIFGETIETDAPRLKGQHKKYLYGPDAILVAHGENEQIGVSELIDSVQIYKKIVKHCLQWSE